MELKYISALVIVLSIDALLIMGQFAVSDINPSGNLSFTSYSNTIFNKYDTGGFVLNTSDIASQVPGEQTPVSTETGEPFSDTFKISRTWLLLGKIYDAVVTVAVGPAVFLANPILNLPLWFPFIIGAVWFLTTLFLIVMFITGR